MTLCCRDVNLRWRAAKRGKARDSRLFIAGSTLGAGHRTEVLTGGRIFVSISLRNAWREVSRFFSSLASGFLPPLLLEAESRANAGYIAVRGNRGAPVESFGPG